VAVGVAAGAAVGVGVGVSVGVGGIGLIFPEVLISSFLVILNGIFHKYECYLRIVQKSCAKDGLLM
jgi:hypothetical protein